ncbi:hypothetical protein PAXINDRAFT_19584 [Paxillus involutus ATCC 200175]|uniref:Extracellular metalloproteinase n=1 Tax=Paxillus involutus ATCC 200175 TaxID=664439 RepID=A0A0C9T7S6_PAXIN|nr:hypothetical protein PAXINDRAFT_19584 [Paxillus involutus ATCC 200175]
MPQYNNSESGRAYVICPESYTDKATSVIHIYTRQIVGGIEVTNAHVNLNIIDGRVLSFGDSFFPGSVPTQHAEAFIHPHANYCAQLSSAFSSHRTLLYSPSATQYYITSHDHAKFEVEMEHNWYETTVTGSLPHRIVDVVDRASDSPMALPVATEEEAELPLSYSHETIKELSDSFASPAGWHTLPVSSDLSVKESNSAGMAPTDITLTPLVKFPYPYAPDPPDTKEDSMAEAQSHIDATVTHLFYINNMAHDLFYQYRFTDAAGNFQQYNFGRGGAEGDAVIANAQDGSGFNNANFMMPPDGQNGRCRVYLWNTASPYPDGDMEAGIVIHELALQSTPF